MASESNTPLNDLIEQSRAIMGANPMIAPQMEQFWKAQDAILEETEAFTKSWFDRRHKAAQTALEALRNVNGDGADPSAATRTMMDWQQHSFQRLASDMQEWLELCSRCANRVSSAEVEGSKKGLEEVAKRAKSTAKTKHATPV